MVEALRFLVLLSALTAGSAFRLEYKELQQHRGRSPSMWYEEADLCDPLPEVTEMWAQILEHAVDHDACEHLATWAASFGHELNVKTGLNVVGGVASVVGVGTNVGTAAKAFHGGVKTAANVAGNIADAWDVADAVLESGEALNDALSQAEHAFDEIRAAHVTEENKTWTNIKRVHMGVSLLVLGGAVTVGTGGTGLPAVIAAGGAATGTFGVGAAVVNQSMIEQDRQGFINFMCNFDHYCTNVEQVPADIAPILNSNMKIEVRDGALMMLPIPQLTMPRLHAPPFPMLQMPRGWRDPWAVSNQALPQKRPPAPRRHVLVQMTSFMRPGTYIPINYNGKNLVTQVPYGVAPNQYWKVRVPGP